MASAVVRHRSSSPSQHSDHFEDAQSEVLTAPPLEPLPPLLDPAGYLAETNSLLDENDVLPSTPLTEEEQEQLKLQAAARGGDDDTVDGVTINQIEATDDDNWGPYLRGRMHNAAEQAEEFAIAMWHKLQSWKVIHFTSLPQWLQDNDFLHFGHRPPLPTSECFKSIIRIHTETGNIWTHLLGR